MKLRGNVAIAIDTTHVTIALLQEEGLSSTEQQFIAYLMAGNTNFTLQPSTADIFLTAAQELSESTRQNLIQLGLVSANRQQTRVLRAFFKVLLMIALVVQFILTYALIFQYSATMSNGYPRYPMNLAELVYTIVIVLLALGIIASGFYQKTLAGKQGLKDWRYVAGLKT